MLSHNVGNFLSFLLKFLKFWKESTIKMHSRQTLSLLLESFITFFCFKIPIFSGVSILGLGFSCCRCHPDVNFTNILRAAFTCESFKFRVQLYLYLKFGFILFWRKKIGWWKSNSYDVGEIDHCCSIFNHIFVRC